MVSKYVQKLVEIAMNEHGSRTFSHFFLSNAKLISSNRATGTLFSYTVPVNICKAVTGGKSPIFTTSTILALFDELSTYGLMLSDKVPRGGVSVHLSTEVVKECYAGQNVTISTKSDKIGKALGYCTMELLDEDGSVLARGKHIKYLPLGKLWDFLASPMILPLTLFFYQYFTKVFPETFLGKWWYRTNVKKHDPSSEDMIADNEVSTVLLKSLAGKKLSSIRDSPYSNPAFNNEVGGLFQALDLERLDGGEETTTCKFEIRVRPHLTNLLRKMHGGAVAAAIEQACILSARKKGKAEGLLVTSMEIRYLSPSQVTLFSV
jgi:acyl-coenzyme A thioesterase PaaI-like protein